MVRQRLTAEFKREAVRLLERGDKPVSQLAVELGVARNRLYKWRDALQVHGDHAFAGSARAADARHRVGRHRMDRLRREHELWTQRRRRFVRTRAAYQRTPAAPRLLEWPFAAAAPNRTWVGDITQIPTREGLLHWRPSSTSTAAALLVGRWTITSASS